MNDCCPHKAEARRHGAFEGPVGEDWFEHDCSGWPSPKQHPWDSVIEVLVNTVISYVTAVLAWSYVIGPLFHMKTSSTDNIGIVGLFTLVSIIRQYLLRRTFDGKSPYAWLVQKLRKEGK